MAGDMSWEKLDTGKEVVLKREASEEADIIQQVAQHNKRQRRTSESPLANMHAQVDALEKRLAEVFSRLPPKPMKGFFTGLLYKVNQSRDQTRPLGEQTFTHLNDNDKGEPSPQRLSKKQVKRKMNEAKLAVNEALKHPSEELAKKANKLIKEAKNMMGAWEKRQEYLLALRKREGTPESPKSRDDTYLVRYTHILSDSSSDSESEASQ